MKNHRNNNSESLALNTFTKLIRAAETITTDVHGELAAYNMTVSQFGVLEALHHLGPMYQRDIAKKILKSTGNLTMVIDNLEKRKLVKRQRNDNDRRYYEIHLTEKGAKLIAAIFPAHAKRIKEKMARLTTAEQLELGRLCKKFKEDHTS